MWRIRLSGQIPVTVASQPTQREGITHVILDTCDCRKPFPKRDRIRRTLAAAVPRMYVAIPSEFGMLVRPRQSVEVDQLVHIGSTPHRAMLLVGVLAGIGLIVTYV